jgi:hypothetical protein
MDVKRWILARGMVFLSERLWTIEDFDRVHDFITEILERSIK